MQTNKVKKSELPAEILAAFPDYKGRKFAVCLTDRVTFSDLHWGGGTRNSYKLVPLVEGATAEALTVGLPWNSPTEGATVALPAGFAVVEHSYFCGRDVGLRVYVNPTTTAGFVAQARPELAS